MIFNTSFGNINLGTLDGILKGNGKGRFAVAEPEVDYQTPIVAGEDYSLPIRTSSITLTTSGWTGSASPYTQTVTIAGTTAKTKVDLQPNATVISQLIEDNISGMYIENNNGVLKAYSIGDEKPTTNLTIQVTLTEIGE